MFYDAVLCAVYLNDMDFIVRLLLFCAFVGFLNFIGISPQYDKPSEMWKSASTTKKIILGTYALLCFIGYITIIGAIIWVFFFAGK